MVKASVKSEWDTPTDILVHQPSIEMFFGSLKPSSVLYEGYLDFEKVKLEHQNFVKVLKEKTNANVYDVKDLMLKNTLDSNGNIIQSEELEKLKELASYSLEYNYDGLDLTEKKFSENEKKQVLDNMHPKSLVNIILGQYKINVHKSFEGNISTESTIEANPLYNIMFVRDQMITTPNGVILGKMNSKERQSETEVLKLALSNIGIKPIYEISGEGRLEGGDYIPIGDVGLLGIGKRTNNNSLEQMIVRQNELFGDQIVAAVRDNCSDQEHMHLDTYMNILDSKNVLISESRFNGEVPQVELYQNGKQINHKNGKKTMDLKNFLLDKFNVHMITEQMQALYGVNFLNTGNNSIVGVDISNKSEFSEYGNTNSVFEDYKKILKNSNVDLRQSEFVDMNHFNRAYGGPHCGTQVLARK